MASASFARMRSSTLCLALGCSTKRCTLIAAPAFPETKWRSSSISRHYGTQTSLRTSATRPWSTLGAGLEETLRIPGRMAHGSV